MTTGATDQPGSMRKLPAGWRWARVGELCDFIRGVTFQKAEAGAKPSAGYLPLLRAGNISGALDLENDLVWVPEHYVSDDQRRRAGDRVVAG